jgi:4-oxalocrotonate tautomerase
MPILQLGVSPLQNPQRYQSLAAALTGLAAGLLGKRPDVTAVTVQDLPPGRWFIGGAAVEQPTAHLEISVTQGTNTAAEKAAFVEQAFAELQRQLAPAGELAPASYVIVREVPATDWGYGGQTQRTRQLAREREKILSLPA